MFLGLALAVLVVVGGGSLLLRSNPPCGEELMIEKPSPDGRYVASLWRRNCGATTPYVAHINLRLAVSRFRQGFFDGVIADGEVYRTSQYSGERFCWSGLRNLEVGYPESGGSHGVRAWHDVTIGNAFRNPDRK